MLFQRVIVDKYYLALFFQHGLHDFIDGVIENIGRVGFARFFEAQSRFVDARWGVVIFFDQ